MGKWSGIPDQVRSELLRRKTAGVSVYVLADEIGMKATTLDRRLREFAASSKHESETLVTNPGIKFQDLSAGPVIDADYAMIIGDMHLPYLDYCLADKMLRLAASKLPVGKRHLIVAGDMFNMDAFKVWPPLMDGSSLKVEVEYARKFLKDCQAIFGDNIHVIMGSHERRMFFRLLGEFDAYDLGAFVGISSVKFYVHSWIVLISDKIPWRVTHQKNWSVMAQSVGTKLAVKYAQNIIANHIHRMSVGYDPSGRFAVIENGCMVNPKYLDYVNLVDSTAPTMTQGFVMLRNGTATPCSNDPKLTDWDILLGDY